MRPINLTLSAFGPYVNEVSVDMDRLGETGVYLITGDTGAGKTTIFDAICFALYGTASGDNRTKQMLRSKYADATTPTFVDMTFEYRGDVYRIRRNPEYERLKARGEGTTTEGADAQFYYPDGRVVAGYEKATKAACELVGLDAKQFSRIAMLAQGDFQKLLNANTEERTEIFRKIFDTVPYKKLQERLGEQANELRNEFRTLSQSILQYLSDVTFDEGHPLTLQLDEARQGESVQVLDAALPIVEGMLTADSEALAALEEKLKQTDSLLEGLAGRIATAEKLCEVGRRLERNKVGLQAALPLLEQASAALKAESERAPERERLTAQIGALCDRLPEYDALEGLTEQGKRISAEVKIKIERSEQLKARAEGQKQALAQARKEVEYLANSEAQRQTAINLQEKNALRLTRLCDIEKMLEADQKAQLDYQRAAGEYQASSEESERLRAQYARLERAFLDGQAGVLASRLREGEPCAVCGSVHHPAPAVMCQDAPSEETLRQYKEKSDAATALCVKQSSFAGECKAAAEKTAQVVRKAFADEFGEGVEIATHQVAAAIKQAERDADTLAAQIEELNAQCERRRLLSEQIPTLEAEQEAVANEQASLTAEIAAEQERVDALRRQYVETIGRLEYKSKQQAQDAVSAKQREKSELEQAFLQAQEAEQKAATEVRELQAAISADEAVLREASVEELAPLKAQYDALAAEKRADTDTANALRVRLSANGTAMNNILSGRAGLSAVEEKLKWADALARTANGTMTGKERFQFETYIQISYFDRVIASANLRLRTMTGGQYELVRAETADNIRSKSGLELNVIDHYNGSQRSVRSLSGGESFKASLALALGLSDVVQSTAGGIQLDAMFIDEGFGSLDEESLEQAMAVLGDLSTGNRLIGIISHVGELKRCIDRQLIVTKDRAGGSQVHIEV